MKNFLHTALAVVLAFSVFFACKKYDNSPKPDPVPEINKPDSMVMAGLQGRVVDENGKPVKDASISSGEHVTLTDVNGIFSFNSIPLSHFYGFVKASKAGYFTGSRTILTSTTAINYVEIKLVPRNLKGSFDAASGATIDIEPGSSVVFPAGALVNSASHISYTGTVKVFASFLDPTTTESRAQMPGDLRGTDKNNKDVGLQSFGMLNVELEGTAGEKLQIAEGKTAQIFLPIPASLQSAAPDNIPLWYFNDTTGKWIEQGTATRKDNQYCGTTSHFTFWNCDLPRELVYFSARIQDAKNNPLANTLLVITETSTGDTRSGFSDATGNISGWILKNAVLSFNMYDHCGNSLGATTVGPFTGDQDLGILTANTTNTQIVSFSGIVNDCSAMPVKNGFVNITMDRLHYAASVVNGNYSISILRCSSANTTAELIAGDYGNNKMSVVKNFEVTSATVNAGTIVACDATFDQFINFSFGGSDYSFTFPPDSLIYNTGSTYTIINGMTGVPGDAGYKYVNFQAPSVTAGTTPLNWIYITINQNYYSNKAADPLSITFTQYDPGQTGYMIGNFSGNIYKDSTGNALPLTGNFRIKE